MTTPAHLQGPLMARNLRAHCEDRQIRIHRKWDDAQLVKLIKQCSGDLTLIEASVGLKPKEVLVK